MVAQPSQPHYMTVDEWRELEEQSEIKHEYINGQVYAMAGGSLAHSFVAVNVVALLNSAFGDGPCTAYNSDAAARLSPTCYTYPDATVTCDEHDFPTTELLEIRVPRVIVEVLSDSTEARDRGVKFRYYRACQTVQEYVLVATKYQAVEVFRRTPNGWAIYQAYGPDEEVELTSIGVRIPLAAFYRRTDVPENMDEPEGQV